MAQERLPMRKVKKVLSFHFDEGRTGHCAAVRVCAALGGADAGAVCGLGSELAGGGAMAFC